MLTNEDDAGDAIGETIINAYKNIKKLKETRYFKTWITRILINECKKMLKTKGKLISIEEYKEEQFLKEDYKEESMDLKNALQALSTEQYHTIMLFYYNDKKISEIAKILNIPGGTVKSRLSKAKEILYQKLTYGKEREISG